VLAWDGGQIATDLAQANKLRRRRP
jgi:hypothetical protein